MLNVRKWMGPIQEWLEEDVGQGDLTEVLFAGAPAERAWIIAKADGRVAGLPLIPAIFQTIDPEVQVNVKVHDGAKIKAGEVLVELEGSPASLLTGERLALNLLQRLSGIATLTSQYIQEVEGLPVRIVDTRKTTPGLRGLEKYAVRMGGGHNHRLGLYDAAMLKDNHIKAAGSITQAVHSLRQTLSHTMKIEVEVENLDQVQEALAAQADIIMLDNMSIEQMKQAVQLIDKKAVVEASGGVNLQTVKRIAETGVDVISVGALTHSVSALDISMDLGQRKIRSGMEG